MKSGQGSTPSSRSRTIGPVEFFVSSKKVDDYREILSKDEPILVTGTVDTPFGEGETARERLRFLDAKPLARMRAEKSSLLDIKLNADLVSEDQLRALEKVLRMHAGACRRSCAWRSQAQREHPGPGRRLQGRRHRRSAGPHRADLRRPRRRPSLSGVGPLDYALRR